MNKSEIISQFEWHDLPVVSFTINDTGFYLIVTPFNESKNTYRSYTLRLYNFTTMSISMGEFDTATLKKLEVSKFDYKENGDSISGEIGIISGNMGYWSLAFENSDWEINENSKKDVQQ